MSEALPKIKASKQGEVFLDYDGDCYINTFSLFHSVEAGERERFGEFTDKGDPLGYDRTFMLDGDPNAYKVYADFAAAYYARFPERIEINRQKEAV